MHPRKKLESKKRVVSEVEIVALAERLWKKTWSNTESLKWFMGVHHEITRGAYQTMARFILENYVPRRRRAPKPKSCRLVDGKVVCS